MLGCALYRRPRGRASRGAYASCKLRRRLHKAPRPWSYDQVWRSLLSAAAAAGIGKLGTHSMRHTYRSWLDAAGTTVAVQQKLMRHRDIRTTMNVYGDGVTNEMQEAHSKVVQMALSKPNGFASDWRPCTLLKNGGSEWGSNPPATGKPAARRF